MSGSMEILDEIRRHQETMQEMATHLRALQMEFERKEAARIEARLRQIIREEIDAALDRREQQGLAALLTSIDADPAPDDEIVAVLATMTAEEWETLVQRVKARKATE